MVTRRSLGYGYVNFHNVADAERALDTMNFTDIKGKPCRIMWSQRDPSLRKSGVGNIFVKNLAPTVDNKGLYDVFSVFGNILSCKITTDENGNSKGYGYVHYETAEAATEAIQKVNGMILEDQEVVVGHFLRRQDRSSQNEWTNLYVKQFSLAWTDEKLRELFSPFGEVNSLKIARDFEGQSKGFAFVDFATHESAAKALDELNGKVVEGEDADGQPTKFELYVNRAQKKAERLRDIRNRTESAKAEQLGKYQGMNLYVKNIDDTITDDDLRELFAPFGTITSARIMREEDTHVSKGFGFVCYGNPEEASRAVSEMNGRMIRSKPLYVTLHQKKEIRRAQLAAAHARMPRFPMGQAPQMPFPYPGQPPMPPRQFPMMPQMMPRGPGRGGPMPPYGFPGRGGYPLPNYAMGMPMGPMGQSPNSPGFKRGGPMGPQQGGRRMGAPGGPGGPGRGGMGGPGNMGPPRGYPPQQQMRQGGPPPPNVKYTNQVRNQPPMQMGGPPMGHPMHVQQQPHPNMPRPSDGLDHNALAQADFSTQKNMIGEKLYPLVMLHQPEFAGKITGMLLEMDNAELLHLLESPEALQSKVHEAMTVLQQHNQG
jgi:polyadenylate-binding protein